MSAKQGQLSFNRPKPLEAKRLGYEQRNLAHAQTILADCAKYDRGGSRCLILWAEMVVGKSSMPRAGSSET